MAAHPAVRTRLVRPLGVRTSRAFTLPEVLVVIGIIAVLIAVLTPALVGALRTSGMVKSQNNMRQIATWMTMYSSDNREYVLPSQFDYSAAAAAGYPVKVRSHASLASTPWGNQQYKGTWTDILWTINGLGTSRALDPSQPDRYYFDSPDDALYANDVALDDNPFRAAAPNGYDFPGGAAPPGSGPTPFGNGAKEIGFPGYFAANNFFNASPSAPPYPTGTPTPASGRWFTTGQIFAPSRSMYLVDSFAGETIEPIDAPYNNDPNLNSPTIEVDFRYTGSCLMLFLDGHSAAVSAWDNLTDLQTSRKIKVQKLDSRSAN